MKHDSDILKRIKSYFMRRKSADEAHAFEREAEKDAFLYEAMEGIEGMLTSDLQQAMDELDDKLDAKTVSKFTVNWQMAASVLALVAVGGSILIFTLSSDDGEGTMSSNESNQNYEPRQDTLRFDTLGSYVFEYTQPIADTLEPDDFSAEPEFAANTEQTVQTTPIPEEPERRELSTNELDIATDDDESIADAAVAEPTEVMDSMIDEVEVGEIALEEEVSEMVEKEELKLAPSGATTTRAKTDESQADSKAAQPKNGMSEYQAYLKNSLKTSDGMPKGTVILSFEVTRSGRPKKIKVIKSLCTACDAEAVRLVENGPDWTSDDRKAMGTININFP